MLPKKMAAKSLRSLMKEEMMGELPEKLKGKMAVKVMADSPEGLKEGLEKAESVLEGEEDEEMGLEGLLKEAFSKRNKKSKKED